MKGGEHVGAEVEVEVDLRTLDTVRKQLQVAHKVGIGLACSTEGSKHKVAFHLEGIAVVEQESAELVELERIAAVEAAVAESSRC